MLSSINPGPLLRGSRALAQFRSSRDFLNGISVRVDTAGLRINSTATLTLFDAEGTDIVRRSRRSTLEFEDGSWQRFPFELIAESPDKTYCFSIETDAEHEAIALYSTGQPPGSGNVEFREHYFEEIAGLLDPLLFRGAAAPPPVPAYLARYLDRHLYQCILLKRYFLLRLIHLADAIGRVGDHECIERVLSIGAGSAYQEAFLAGRIDQMKVHATDTEPCPIAYPMPNLTNGYLDLLAGPGEPEYDLVFSIECLEHIKDYRTAFRNKVSRVKPGKFLYVSVPFATREEQRDEELRLNAWEHAQHFTPGFSFEDLEELFEENGLDLLHASNMFHCDIVHPLRSLVDHLDPATVELAAGEIVELNLRDISENCAGSCREAEGIRFLGKRRPSKTGMRRQAKNSTSRISQSESPIQAARKVRRVNASQVWRELRTGRFAFIDCGCGSGGSLSHCERRFGKRPGLGLDWYEVDLDIARSQGFAVVHCDVMSVELPAKCVGYSSMLDVLEHLPDEASAVGVMEKLALASKDFLFIRHPSFDDMEYLAKFGLKLTWTDWTGHTNMMKIADFQRVFKILGWNDYVIIPHMPFENSTHPAIVPISAPIDTLEYNAEQHGPKGEVRFDRPIYGKFDIFVRLNPNFDEETWRLTASVKGWDAIWE